MRSILTFNATWTSMPLLACSLVLSTSCNNGTTDREPPPLPETFANFAHLDHLGETAGPEGAARIIHIYAESPDYHWVGDDDEGIACVDDAARAAVVYLRDFELNGSTEHKETAEQLIRFLLHMQAESGLFYNFVWDSQLTINETHKNSVADAFSWWSSRAVWALGEGARVLKTDNPIMSQAARDAVERTYPHLEQLLSDYGKTRSVNGRDVPTWLVGEFGSDATSELLLGLGALNRAYPDERLSEMIDKFADGVSQAQWGSMAQFPWSAHGSWIDSWHGWGSSQTQALAEIGRLDSPVAEAEQFYPRLLVDGWMHSFNLDDPSSIRTFEQIAYTVRCVSVGLLRLHEATGDSRYAVMAGLAASWFAGNNVAGVAMYDPTTGRGFDGINNLTHVNTNAGAESTIEALFTMLEIDQVPEARPWRQAVGAAPQSVRHDGKIYRYRVFSVVSDGSESRMAVVMNLTDETLDLLFDSQLDQFLNG